MVAVRAVAWIASVLCVLFAYRWTHSRSRTLAAILAFGIIGRAALGIGLFVVSAFGLPLLKSLQIGGGFWVLAIDAKSYFDAAAGAAQAGLATINDVSPSPTYLRVFAAWLHVAGISPASAVLFNLLCYVAIALVIVAASRSAVASVIALITVTIDPAFVVFGTQALKDSFFMLAVVLAVVGVRLWCDGLDPGERHGQARLAGGLLLMALGIYVVAGIRPYVAVFILLALMAAAVASFAIPHSMSRWRLTLASVVMLMLMSGVFAGGAGAYFPYYRALAESVVLDPFVPVRDLDQARTGFVNAGGATSVEESVPPSRSDPEHPIEAAQGSDMELGVGTRATRLLRGAAVFFIPIWLLHALSVVTFTGGRGLLFIADIDTVVMDVSLAACFWVLARRRLHPQMIPLVVFVAVLSLFAAVSLAYVVTNFGTLFRLRLIAVAPIWLLPALVRRRADQPVKGSEAL